MSQEEGTQSGWATRQSPHPGSHPPRPGKASLDNDQEAGDKKVRRAGPGCRQGAAAGPRSPDPVSTQLIHIKTPEFPQSPALRLDPLPAGAAYSHLEAQAQSQASQPQAPSRSAPTWPFKPDTWDFHPRGPDSQA